ncbi:CYTH-like domain-containing protein [Globomyces pollinis-pini]|nr:CYTH-like domain-containing protein [Globomyces pollinis-pini]
MEVELKFRIPNEATYIKLLDLFNNSNDAQFISTDQQQNYFFDNTLHELENQRTTFRLRRVFSTSESNEIIKKLVMTMKGKHKKGKLENGIARVGELEQVIENADFDLMITNPTSIPSFQSKYHVIPELLDELSNQDISLTHKFENKRTIFKWKELKIEIDETQYTFGTAYEVEVEHHNPEKTKILLETFLRENDIPFSYSTRSKFGNMKAGSVL